MKITSRELRQIELATIPGPHATTAQVRPSIVLTLRDQDGRTGVGEASPLPAYSPDEIDEVQAFLQSLPSAMNLPDLGDSRALLDCVAPLLSPASASARFAVETALLDLIAQRQNVPMWKLLAPSAPQTVPLAVVFDDPLEVEDIAVRVGSAHTVKIKVGRDWPRERDVASAVRKHMPNARLRFDYNRHSGPPTLEELSHFQPEFVEEPEPSPDWTDVRGAPVSLALDETLQDEAGFQCIERIEGRPSPIRFCVLKPTTCGGILRGARLVEAARRSGLRVVVSHTLEGEVARSALLHLAFAWMDGTTAAGLGPGPGDEPLLRRRLVRPDDPGLHLSRA